MRDTAAEALLQPLRHSLGISISSAALRGDAR